MAAAQVARTLQNLPGSRSSLSLVSTVTGRNSFSPNTPRPGSTVLADAGEKPVAFGTGVSCSIVLAEPHIYLNGFDDAIHNHTVPNSTAMIRGKLILNVTKSAKIKAVTLSFCGRARTEWPEGTNFAVQRAPERLLTSNRDST
jgi:arrestin-related trafficking adapter 3/6